MGHAPQLDIAINAEKIYVVSYIAQTWGRSYV